MKKVTKSFILFFIIIICFAADVYAKGSLLIKNARLIEGTNAPIREDVSISILNGKITKIGKNISAQGILQINVHGAYVLPCLISSWFYIFKGNRVARRSRIISKRSY